jgi:kynureninase
MDTPAPLDGFEPDRAYARSLDATASWELDERFEETGTLYLDGNSLGPIAEETAETLHRVIDEWRRLGIGGWTDADPPWFGYGEYLGERLSPILGADADEVVVANSTTTNVHTLIGTFLAAAAEQERGQRVLVNELDFPTDHYAIRAQLRLRGLDPETHLVSVGSPDGRTIPESAVEAALEANPQIGIVFLPSVLYRSGQLLDIDRLTQAAHDHDAFAGFDLAHSVGVVPHALGASGVDFATWCHYKYLNAGPGAVAGLFVARQHWGLRPALPGWWGHEKATQFDMLPRFTPAHGAGAWQIGTIPMLSAAPIEGATDLIARAGDADIDAGIRRLRARSSALTGYLIRLVERRLPACTVGTPTEPGRRGGHVAIEHPESYRLSAALNEAGIVVDYRPPNVLRVCPSPYYVGFADVWDVVESLRVCIETADYERFDSQPDGVV